VSARSRPAAALLAALATASCAPACGGGAPPAPEVRIHAAPGLPAAVLAEVAARFAGVRAVPVAAARDAELVWAADPAEALAPALGAIEGSAPDATGVAPRWRDARGRFLPLAARARVLLLRPRARLPLEPSNLRDLADARLRGRIALVPLGRGEGPTLVAALSLAYGERSAGRFVRLLARNAPVLVEREDDVRARLAAGAADAGLATSLEGAAGAASAAALEVVYPDQGGAGAVVLPTAVVLRGGAGEGARRLAAWLATPEAERVLVARVPGLLPLRPEVPVPVGVEPAGNLVALPISWDALAEARARQAEALARWPDGFTDGPTSAGP
jgi:iron(III) transport system substrate-binding protein